MIRTEISSKWGRQCRMANTITGIRIVLSIALLFCPILSPTFYVLYIAAGFSDMIDGAVARKTGTVSKFGTKLDMPGWPVGLLKRSPLFYAAERFKKELNTKPETIQTPVPES